MGQASLQRDPVPVFTVESIASSLAPCKPWQEVSLDRVVPSLPRSPMVIQLPELPWRRTHLIATRRAAAAEMPQGRGQRLFALSDLTSSRPMFSQHLERLVSVSCHTQAFSKPVLYISESFSSPRLLRTGPVPSTSYLSPLRH